MAIGSLSARLSNSSVLNLPEQAAKTHAIGKTWTLLLDTNTHSDRVIIYCHSCESKKNPEKIHSVEFFFLIYFLSVHVDYNC